MRLRTLCLCLFSLAALLRGKQTPDDAAEIVNRARKIVTDHLFHTLNYACVPTIQRSFFAPEHNLPIAGCAAGDRGKNIMMKNRLRLDIAVAGGQEIYSWTLKAGPITLSREIQKMGAIYGWPLPSSVIPIINRGVIVSTSSQIHLEKRLSLEWITPDMHQPLGPPP